MRNRPIACAADKSHLRGDVDDRTGSSLLLHFAGDSLRNKEGRPDIDRHNMVEIRRGHLEKRRRAIGSRIVHQNVQRRQAAMEACIAGRSVTSNWTAWATPPASTIASRAASISAIVRAARMTSAPACASAAAAARPRPLPAPVTSARFPSRRRAAFGESRSFSGLRVGHVSPAVAAHADVGLLGVAGEAFQHAEPRAVLADRSARRVGQNALVGEGLEELADPKPAGVAGGLLGRQRMVGADHLVAVGDVGARSEEQRSVIASCARRKKSGSRVMTCTCSEAIRSATRTISSSLSQTMTWP